MDTLLVTGAKASHNHTVHTMHSHMNKAKSSLVKLDDVGDVLIEAVSDPATAEAADVCGQSSDQGVTRVCDQSSDQGVA